MKNTSKIKDWVELPVTDINGRSASLTVSLNGESRTKHDLKVINRNRATLSLMEVDNSTRTNIFRKFLLTDIVKVDAFLNITLRDGVLPRREDSSWDNIGRRNSLKTFKF